MMKDFYEPKTPQEEDDDLRREIESARRSGDQERLDDLLAEAEFYGIKSDDVETEI